ncbi:MAG TPA: hypothetical protein VM841_00755, partial [Actinomycetota bacterium]|nr:hypothetical protein [Actinomycetota bacterium]
MSMPNRPSWRPLAGATTVLLVLSAISFVVLRDQPARAAHSDATIDVVNTAETVNGLPGGTVSWSVTAMKTNADFSQSPVAGLVILAEIEGGSNDPDGNVEGDQTFGLSYGTPDLKCTTGSDGSCDIQFTPYALQGTAANVRIWIQGGVGIDTNEGLVETSQAGCGTEPDGTEVVAFTSQTTSGTAPARAAPGAEPNPTV